MSSGWGLCPRDLCQPLLLAVCAKFSTRPIQIPTPNTPKYPQHPECPSPLQVLLIIYANKPPLFSKLTQKKEPILNIVSLHFLTVIDTSWDGAFSSLLPSTKRQRLCLFIDNHQPETSKLLCNAHVFKDCLIVLFTRKQGVIVESEFCLRLLLQPNTDSATIRF